MEETGLQHAQLIRALGVEDYDVRPGRNEIHERHFFHLTTGEPTADEWLAFEEMRTCSQPASAPA